jgi:hypothetical protein
MVTASGPKAEEAEEVPSESAADEEHDETRQHQAHEHEGEDDVG